MLAPDFLIQNRCLIISSVHGPSRRLLGISTPSATSVLTFQLQSSQGAPPSRFRVNLENPAKSLLKYSMAVSFDAVSSSRPSEETFWDFKKSDDMMLAFQKL